MMLIFLMMVLEVVLADSFLEEALMVVEEVLVAINLVQEWDLMVLVDLINREVLVDLEVRDLLMIDLVGLQIGLMMIEEISEAQVVEMIDFLDHGLVMEENLLEDLGLMEEEKMMDRQEHHLK